MATIPIYDETTLPCLVYPFVRTREATQKFLGRNAIVGQVYIEVNMVAKTDAEMEALAHFWKIDCNFGLEPFLIDTPLTDLEQGQNALLVQWMQDVTFTKQKSEVWEMKHKLKVLGIVIYVIDDQDQFVLDEAGDFIFTDTGDYLSTGNSIDNYREIIWQ